jgi:hypothetical protein
MNRREELAEHYHTQLARDRVAVADAVRHTIADEFDGWADYGGNGSQTWAAFARWVRALPDDHDVFTVLAAYGDRIGGRTWGDIIDNYLVWHVGNDSFGLTVPNLVPVDDDKGPRASFEEFLGLLVLDAVASALYDAHLEV